MPLVLTEHVSSRTMTEARKEGRLERTLKMIYTITGSDDPADSAVVALGPQPNDAYGDGSLDLYVISREYDVINTGPVKALRLTVTYGPPERLPIPNDTNDPQYELDLMAETVHIEEAIDQKHYPSDKNKVNFAIGLNGGRIDGVDIYVPRGAYSETHEKQTISKEYRNVLMGLTGKINNATWKGWNKGEALFLGARGTRKGKGVWSVQYHFAIQPNKTQRIQTEGGLVTFDKTGWDYMWMERVQTAAGDGLSVERKVQAVHVANVYPYADFKLLGIGSL